MNELLKKLNIEGIVETSDGYEYATDDYDEFTDIYNKLESYTKLVKNSPQSFLNESGSHVEFDGDNYFVYLDADFNIDDYILTITKG